MNKQILLTVDYGDMVKCSEEPYDEKKIAELMEKASSYGVKKILWRVSCGGRSFFQSNVIPPVDDTCGKGQKKTSEILKRLDPLKCAVHSAHENGIQLYGFVTLFDFNIE
ncbi:unnamed protein product, partial [marine sediment metagenome]